MFYAVASAVLANEVDVVIRIAILIINNRDCSGQRYHLHHNLQIAKHKRRELEEEELLEQEREEMMQGAGGGFLIRITFLWNLE